MTRLLVSVRDALEAAAALAGGADIIDIKEPRRGSLGAADPGVWRAVAAVIDGRRPLSAALGELSDPEVTRRAASTSGLQFAKVGLSGTCHDRVWPERWRRVLEQLAPQVAPVAVSYADWQAAAAPPPLEVLAVARHLDCRAFLLDTFSKQGQDLFDWMSMDELRELCQGAQRSGMAVALAGSLTAARLPRAARLAPEWIAVRGAVCPEGREGAVCETRVRQLSSMLKLESLRVAAKSAPLA